MAKFVLVAHPRSCSTWIMRQLRRSKVVKVIKDDFGELTTPGYRWWTRKNLGLEPLEGDPEVWDHDQYYAERFFLQRPNGAFKVLGHANSAAFYRWLYAQDDITFATLERTDMASAIASELSCIIRLRNNGEKDAFKNPARKTKIRYADMLKFDFKSVDYRRARMLEFFYFSIAHKCTRWVDFFKDHPRTIAALRSEDLSHGGGRILEDFAETQFDWAKLVPQSHYSEIFEDWKLYEDDIRDILGII